jgi:predicted lactoylglutathione lyase
MTTPAHPGRTFIVNMPVADVARSTAFFAKLGFSFEPTMGDGQNASMMLVGEHALVMLSSRELFAQYSHLPVADPATHALATYTFTVSSRDEVDSVSAIALANGAREADGAEDHGFMYTRSFFDLDGHGWQVMWTDPAAAAPGADAHAQAATTA